MKLCGFPVPLEKFLEPGDALLYGSNGGLFSRIISIKTWHPISHCEAYAGNLSSVASRDGQGVNYYSLRTSELKHVLRPNEEWDYNLAFDWFLDTAKGQKYDWWGLLRFVTIGKGKTDRMFCSEFLTRFYRAGGLEPFQKDEDADLIAPCSFLLSPAFDHYVVSEVNGRLVVNEAGEGK